MLQIKEIYKNFGGLSALSDVSFAVQKGEIKALIGPNGAGKTTMLHIITGILPPDSGEVLFGGQNIAGMPPFKIASLGISRTFQHVDLFGSLSVLENVMVGRHMKSHAGFISTGLRSPFVIREEKAIRDKALEILQYVGLAHKADELASSLPIGEERMLEIARALATEPTLLLLDEPASGLNDVETIALSSFIQRLRDELGITVMLVEHDMGLVMNISDNIVVLDFGEKIAEGIPDEIKTNQAVIDAYLGEDCVI